MENTKPIIFLFICIVIGILFGVLISAYTNSDTKKNSNQTNIPSFSGDINNNEVILQLTENSDSGDLVLNNAEKPINEEVHIKQLPATIKAVYLTGWSAGNADKRKTAIENLNKYGFNAVVIDIKDEAGNVSYDSKVQTAIDISSSKKMISDIKNVIEDFHNSNIYVIGRIVTFKDPTYAKNISANAYHMADNTLWKDYSNNCWPNPYNPATWEYPISLAEEAAELGFDEIQFDYIRFPSSEGKTKNIAFGFESNTKNKSEIINEFLKYAMSKLDKYNVIVSADVFGITTKKRGDFEHIGQAFYEIAKIVDVICPMVYPSHYGYGEYGISKPDKEPYKIVKFALNDAKKQYDSESGDIKLAEIRPYLQDFTASWLKKGNYILYDTKAVTDQIQACYDLNINNFILWDPSNKYAYEALNNVILSNSGDILKTNQ